MYIFLEDISDFEAAMCRFSSGDKIIIQTAFARKDYIIGVYQSCSFEGEVFTVNFFEEEPGVWLENSIHEKGILNIKNLTKDIEVDMSYVNADTLMKSNLAFVCSGLVLVLLFFMPFWLQVF